MIAAAALGSCGLVMMSANARRVMSGTNGNAEGRTLTLHMVSSLDGFIAKKDNGSPGWRVLEASTKPVLEQEVSRSGS